MKRGNIANQILAACKNLVESREYAAIENTRVAAICQTTPAARIYHKPLFRNALRAQSYLKVVGDSFAASK